MKRIFTVLIFIFWTACYARCVAEQVGLLQDDVLACCQKDAAQGQNQHPSDTKPCGVCDAITLGTLTVSVPFVFACLMLSAMAVLVTLTWNIGRWMFSQRVPGAGIFSDYGGPPVTLSLWEYLVRTALPVRGPDMILA